MIYIENRQLRTCRSESAPTVKGEANISLDFRWADVFGNSEHLSVGFDLLVGQSAEIAFAIVPRNENRSGINRTEKPSVSLHAAQLGFLVSENHAIVIEGIQGWNNSLFVT